MKMRVLFSQKSTVLGGMAESAPVKNRPAGPPWKSGWLVDWPAAGRRGRKEGAPRARVRDNAFIENEYPPSRSGGKYKAMNLRTYISRRVSLGC